MLDICTAKRDRLVAERVAHVNRVKDLCATQGIYDYEPLRSVSSAPAPPQQRTGNAQQCRRHKALMRHTAAGCFPSTRVG
jgi:hypothetical protein